MRAVPIILTLLYEQGCDYVPQLRAVLWRQHEALGDGNGADTTTTTNGEVVEKDIYEIIEVVREFAAANMSSVPFPSLESTPFPPPPPPQPPPFGSWCSEACAGIPATVPYFNLIHHLRPWAQPQLAPRERGGRGWPTATPALMTDHAMKPVTQTL